DRDNHRIQKFDSSGTYLGGWGGQLGNRPGQMNRPCAVAAGADGRIYVVDGANHRVEAFREEFGAPEILKAIIVAGGGPYASNTLWPVTQLCTNLAYQSLANQGFSKDTVRYFSWNAKLDLDGNGLADDVAGEPTNSNVHNAISVWAADADHLVLYLVGHGGDGFYVLGETEVLTSRDLGVWLDETQRTVPLVTVVYDANASGSFLPFLVPSGRSQRIVIASTAAAEKAYFVTRGTISFSNYFWANVFNGHSVLDSFNSARKDLSDVAGYQNPQLDDNADGVYDPKSGDGTLADNTYIGFGNAVYDERPTIGSVSPPQTLDADETSASLSADNVADDRTVISRVWAIITAPVAAKAGTEDPVEELPSVDLVQGETDAYEGTYEEFTEAGEYQVDVYAQDWVGNVSEVAQTTVTKSGVLPGTLVGVVTDADTADAIEGALVALTDYGDLSTHTDASGAYVFPALPVDTYRVRASAGDYVSQTKQADVLSGETTTVDFALASIAAVTVTVNQATGQPDPTNTMPIQFAVVFNESVTGFEWRDVAWAGTAAAISGSVQGGGANYTISVAELAGDGTVVPVIPTGVAQNGSGVYNQASTSTDATVEYDVTPPGITLDGPSTMLTTSGPVTYTVWYGNANSVSLSNQDVAVSATGSAAVGDATVSGTGPEQRFVTLSSISGDGTLGITVAAATAQDAAGNLAGPAGPSGTCAVDNTAPTITLGEPSAPFAATGPISFAVSYVGADSVSIAEEDVTLSTTGSAAASTIEVTGAGAAERTITVLGIAGDGTLGVSVAAGTAQDVAGNSAGAAGPSAMAVIDNTPPAISIGEPSATVTAAGPVTYTVSCSGAATVVLAAEHVALHATGTASGSVAVAGAGAETRTVTLSDISGDGSLAISLAAGVAIDEAGNQTLAAGPSTPFLVDSAMVSVAIHPPSVDVTRAGPVVYTVSYANAVNVSLSESDITLNSTGTAAGGVSVTGTGVQTRTVTLADIVGDGALSLTIASATAEDELGNPAPGAGPSAPVTADNAPPALSVGVPSVGLTAAGPVSFTVVYEGADMVALTQDDVLLAGEGTATGAVTIDEFKAQEKGDITRVVTVSDITGDGTLGVSLAAGTAHDLAGNLAAAAGPSAFCTVDNTPPALELSGPSIPVTRAGPIVYTVTYFGAETVTLSPGDVALDATGTATGTVAVSGTGCSERQVNLLNVAGDGTLGVAVAAGTASDAAGNTSSAAQSSLPCVVDNTRPVITLLGDNPATVLMAGTYADAGATAYDEVDGDLTSAIETVDAVDTSQPGAYAVVYSVQDAAGNGAQLTRTVNVISGGEGEGEGEGDGGPPDIVIGCGGTGASNTAGPLNGSNGNAVLMASLGVFLFLSRRKALFWSAKI
ncbi:MAG TPA: DUF5011 domain-containing protein, partial [Candidatus Hydrogenedentes bacterium]|nr:DUF5011 domain-containing protein [Candidatus Hydrogenedentota bacterium]